MDKFVKRISAARELWTGAVGLAVLALAGALLLGPVYAEPGAKAEAGPKAKANTDAKAPGVSAKQANADPDALKFFKTQVRPILEKRCIKCHGGEKVEAKLNFATRETMLKGGKSGAVIDWRKPKDSLLLTAISYTDIDYEMPPSGKMPAKEIETIKKWLAMGLPWTPGKAGQLADPGGETQHKGPASIEDGKKYWAYKPLKRPEVPEVDDKQWAEHPIDAFIYAGLAKKGLKPNPKADRVTLIRRATYNLTGLPPTPAEVQAFVNDKRPGAWERVIDRLLASKHYGEQWARHWMDISRYAETNGYERDGKKRNIWRYRDYLIRAFNSDKPYDRFVMEHVAGDLLPDRDTESYLATGFNRLQIWDDEPTDRVQARADYISDIVDTTTSAFLATTLACARCHDHKKDPIKQSDYYGLYAFYNNIQEQLRGRDDAISKNLMDLPQDKDQRKAAMQWEARVKSLTKEVKSAEASFIKSVGENFKRKRLSPIAPDSRAKHQAWRYMMKQPKKDWHVQQFDDSDWSTAKGGFGYGIKQRFLPNEWKSGEIYLRRNFRLTKEPKHLTLSIAHKGPTEVYINGIRVYSSKSATGPRHRQVQLSDKALQAVVVGSNSLAVSSKKLADGLWFIDAGLYEGVVNERTALRAAIDADGPELMGKKKYQAYREARSDLDKLLAKPIAKPYPAMVLNEQGRNAPKQHILLRGNAHSAGDVVPPRFPLVLGGAQPKIPDIPSDLNATGRRLALAKWLASEDNPLTARVMINRVWQHQFGRGIVRSSSDFGQLGTKPTHPELLNYLAAEFIKRDWSIKQMQKFIMTSRAFQMSSAAQQEGLKKDSGNDLFWRFDMRRLTAEEFRDSLLAINGSLNPKQFGPSFYTIMPKEVLATASRPGSAWGTSSESERNRRSVYIHIKRSLREPLLVALDQAETDSPCPVRFATTVPTQTLITLNSDVMQRESKVFADRLVKEAGPTIQDKVKLGLTLVLCKAPTDKQLADNVAFVQKLKKDHGLSEQRALELFCLVAYNLNAFMYLD